MGAHRNRKTEPGLVAVSESAASDYLLFKTRQDTVMQASLSEDLAANPAVHFAYLRVELTRLRTGMSDFLFKVSAPSYNAEEKPVVVTLKGDKSFGTFDGCVSASKVIFREMESRGSTVCNWGSANKEYLARMLEGPCKVFVQRTNIDSMSFTTDALH